MTDHKRKKFYNLLYQTPKMFKVIKLDATTTYFNPPSHYDRGRDLLDRYANLSTKVRVLYVDPDRNPQAARDAGVKKYSTTIVQIGAKKEEAKGLTETDVTGPIIRDLKTNTRTVCFVSGTGEHQIEDSDRNGFSQLKDSLGHDNYATKSISLLTKAEVPSECTVLVVGGPQKDYQQPSVDAIKKYVEGGGRALFLLDPPLKTGRMQVAD